MTRDEIVYKVKSLNFPKDAYVAFGSCPLALFEIREAEDIDLLVSRDLYAKLGKMGWKKKIKGPKDYPFTFDVFEAHDSWDFSSYNPTLEELLKRSVLADDIPFASLEDVRKWKAASGRKKDLVDIKLIDNYFAKQ